MRITLIALLVLLLAAGCGQRGALYLRDNPPSSVKPPRPEPFKPLPYPQEAGEEPAAGSDKK